MADLLLVDNDARILELLALFLKRRGHTVRTAASFAQARVEIETRVPELMLSDLELGQERGGDELPALSREGRLPPTLVVSGYLDRELEARLAALPNVVGMIAKPFDLAALEARIEACTARRGV